MITIPVMKIVCQISLIFHTKKLRDEAALSRAEKVPCCKESTANCPIYLTNCAH